METTGRPVTNRAVTGVVVCVGQVVAHVYGRPGYMKLTDLKAPWLAV